MKDLDNIVIIREYKNSNELVALFPYECNGKYCISYQTLGQHSNAIYHHMIKITKPINYERQEVRDFLQELQSIGYTNLTLRKKISYERIS